MKIEHLGIWVDDIENMRRFYQTYFNMACGDRYFNPVKQFTSYFLSFGDSGARIELMHRPDIESKDDKKGATKGMTHFAVSVGSENAVDELTERLRNDNYIIVGEPRKTGDGYYESVVADPEGNHIEITS